MAYPFFSVIIPTYNRVVLLKRALDSLVLQTYKDFEVIICDDGSTDNTREIVYSFKSKLDINYIWEEHLGGPARPRNNGIRIAKSDWICFLDSDDTCLPEKLENYKKYVSEYDVIYHDLVGLNVSGKDGSIKAPVFDNILLYGTVSLITSSACIRKTIINAVKGIDENIVVGVEDYDLYLKIAQITERFKYIPLNLGEYHFNNNNLHYNVFKMYMGTMQVLNKYKDHPLFNKAIKKRQVHYFLYFTVFNKSEAMKLFPSIISFNFSFFAGAVLLVTPAFLSKAAVRFIVKYFLKEYSYIVK